MIISDIVRLSFMSETKFRLNLIQEWFKEIFKTLQFEKYIIRRPNRVTYFFDNFPKDSVTIENAKFNHPFSPKFLGRPRASAQILKLFVIILKQW
ncbi:hypothetical protein BpHYR1_053257 [Brachionus plicatilis]|uniref:Uncharacterized protein n=1 Tax=Brachionus plicatilis TaxID=10195 RepID=A0A3M7T196_BRAPC|nr:hypothetical protein BpHYR1_053257 [Brachionus plicatilis]